MELRAGTREHTGIRQRAVLCQRKQAMNEDARAFCAAAIAPFAVKPWLGRRCQQREPVSARTESRPSSLG